MNKLIWIFIFALIAGCTSPVIEMAEETEEQTKQDILREQYPNYDYYLELHRDGKWQLENTDTTESEIGSRDWAERNLRNPENIYKIPDDAPYSFDFNNGISFIK
jgi:hypothetical protein